MSDVQQKIQDDLTALKNTLKEYIVADMEWKKRAEPVVTFYSNMTFTNTAFLYVLRVIGAVGTAVATLYFAIKYFTTR